MAPEKRHEVFSIQVSGVHPVRSSDIRDSLSKALHSTHSLITLKDEFNRTIIFRDLNGCVFSMRLTYRDGR